MYRKQPPTIQIMSPPKQFLKVALFQIASGDITTQAGAESK